MARELYERDSYLDKSIPYLISKEITEYDIKSAGFNISRYFKLLSEDQLNLLESLDKKKRQVQIGLFQRENPVYKQELNDKFKEIRKKFFESNNLSEEDIHSIKKDAIFVYKKCLNTSFDNIQFVEKNTYSSYYYINRLEFYVKDDTIDVKGISDDKLSYHRDYMLDFLHTIFKTMERSSFKLAIKYIREFIDHYKRRLLDFRYYRELNRDSLFKLNIPGIGTIVVNEEAINNESLDTINITYNYMSYIIPLINLNI